jgi:8-oxo-dGTP diphosphatase
MEKVAVILLRNANGEVLLQHRTTDAPTFPDHWAFFGGHLEAGETPEQAVFRETLEELAYPLTQPRLIKTYYPDELGADYTMYVFTEDYSGADLVLGEGQGLGWFRPAATEHLLMSHHDRLILNQFAKMIDRP